MEASSSAMLPGQACTCPRISGVTPEPIEMPRSRKAISRAARFNPTGSPASAAAAVAIIAPISQAAGSPSAAASPAPIAADAAVANSQPSRRKPGRESTERAILSSSFA